MRDLVALHRAELHIHLEGSMRVAAASVRQFADDDDKQRMLKDIAARTSRRGSAAATERYCFSEIVTESM